MTERAVIVGSLVDRQPLLLPDAAARGPFEQLLGILPAGVLVCLADGTIDYFNSRAAELWGATPFAHRSTHRDFLWPFLRRADGSSFSRYEDTPIAQAIHTGARFRNVELQLHRPDGSHVWLYSNIDPVRDAADRITGVVCAFVDATPQKRAQEQLQKLNEQLEHHVAQRTRQLEHRAAQLRALARELTLAEQRERERIAALLHDDLVQMLAVSKIQLSLLHRRLRENPAKAGEAVAALEGLIDESITFTRTLMSDLTPPTLNRRNLGAAVRWVAEKLQRHDLAVEVVEDQPLDDLAEDAVIVLFQSVRELLFNVVKHAGVRCARVHLARHGPHVEVAVTDDGRGFDATQPAEPTANGGFGLFHLCERLDQMGGRATITSTPGQGTRVTLRLPCEGVGGRE